MGPAPESALARAFEAPQLSSNTDKLEYRNSVRMWARQVRASANGGSNISRGIAGSLFPYFLYEHGSLFPAGV